MPTRTSLCLALVVAAACGEDVDPILTTEALTGPLSGETGGPDGSTSSAGETFEPTVGESENGTTEGGLTETGPAGPSHGADIQPIWDANCVAACHDAGGSGTLQTELVLTSDVAFTNLYFVPAAQLPEMPRVLGGSRDDSYLWHKLAGTHTDVGGAGTKMPLGKTLSDADLELIGAWIDAGAPP